jgi:Holliday junction resolvase RusA-like endonuclease
VNGIKLTLPYPPQANHVYTVARGRKILSSQGRAYKQAVAVIAALSRGARLIEEPVEVNVKIYRPRRAGDLDNTLKVLLDSLTGCIWKDDKQVVRIVAERFDDKANPRAEVTVTAA